MLKGLKPTFVVVQTSANHQTASAATRLVHAQLKVTSIHGIWTCSTNQVKEPNLCAQIHHVVDSLSWTAGIVRKQQYHTLSGWVHHKAMDTCRKHTIMTFVTHTYFGSIGCIVHGGNAVLLLVVPHEI